MNPSPAIDLQNRDPSLRHLPLHDLHVALGARMVPFAGFSMPIHYELGILGEHRHARTAAGLFDVSHMGQIIVRSRSGDQADAARALETLMPADLAGLRVGRQRYAFFTTERGGIIDDLMIGNMGDFWYLVVNAATADADLGHLLRHLSAQCTVEALKDRVLMALQGPAAWASLTQLVPGALGMTFMDVREISVLGAPCFIARSGYTGEDGFEMSVPASAASGIAERLLEQSSVRPIGLGARDSLRLEAGLCLYGNDLSADTTPVEAGLEWAIAPVRRAAGTRAGGFPGSDVILAQLAHGAARRRVGLLPQLRPVRAGAMLHADATSTEVVGTVTSGTFSPSANHPVAMGYVPTALAQVGTRLFADVRGQRTPVTVAPLPFVPHRYCR